MRGVRTPRRRRPWGDASPRSEKLEGDVTQDSKNEVAQIRCLFRFLWYFRDSRGVATDIIVGVTNRRQVANLPPKYRKIGKGAGFGPLHSRIWRGTSAPKFRDFHSVPPTLSTTMRGRLATADDSPPPPL